MRRKAAGVILVGTAVLLFGQSAWIYVKANLAQALLARAWRLKLEGEAVPRPWPWADTWPVALLRVPSLDESLLVLEGASARNMAFGPTYFAGSRAPGAASNTVVSGHRDTHFAFLEKLSAGDELWLDTPDALRHRYRVVDAAVVDEWDNWVAAPTPEKMLTLVTCYPFDAIVPGGPGRYVVRAMAVTEPGRAGLP